MKKLMLPNNFYLAGEDDDGIVALAEALPPTLEDLDLKGMGCGDRGMAALAAALPALTRLRNLEVNDNHRVRDVGWTALADALPKLPALRSLDVTCCMTNAGALAIAAVLPRCSPTLVRLELSGEQEVELIGEEALSALRTAWGTRGDGLGAASWS